MYFLYVCYQLYMRFQFYCSRLETNFFPTKTCSLKLLFQVTHSRTIWRLGLQAFRPQPSFQMNPDWQLTYFLSLIPSYFEYRFTKLGSKIYTVNKISLLEYKGLGMRNRPGPSVEKEVVSSPTKP